MTGGQITNQDLYNAQRATEQQLGALAVQVAGMAAASQAVLNRLDSGSATMRDYESRLRVLERTRWRAAGMVATLGTLSGGGAATVATWLLSRH